MTEWWSPTVKKINVVDDFNLFIARRRLKKLFLLAFSLTIVVPLPNANTI